MTFAFEFWALDLSHFTLNLFKTFLLLKTYENLKKNKNTHTQSHINYYFLKSKDLSLVQAGMHFGI